ncbi:MAG: glycosyltransferase family 2 protein [Deltaproteobacteria bacterium]|nr:glycosyltransferase family 2 protein [Deltaproteobacteria bacterium]
MEIFILINLLLGPALLSIFYFTGRGYAVKSYGRARSLSAPSPEVPEKSPRVAMIIPAAGKHGAMKTSLESLLRQDYPNFEVIFVTRDADDPASAVIRELVARKKNARHILSGPATQCGQKNHNHLAGIAAADPATEILVFCDSTHEATPLFLSHLVRPISEGSAVMTSGFHRIIPGDAGLTTLRMLLTVLCIHMLQGIKLFTQPWGGAMAIDRKVFEACGIARNWARVAVDDITMGSLLRKKGIRCKAVPEACLSTHLMEKTSGDWRRWMMRQLLGMKYYDTWCWIALPFGLYCLTVPILYAGLAIIGGLFGFFHWSMCLAGAAFFILYTGIGLAYRRPVPEPIPRAPWLQAFYSLLFMITWCYLKTCLTDTLTWKGISYRIAWDGTVKSIHYE